MRRSSVEFEMVKSDALRPFDVVTIIVNGIDEDGCLGLPDI
jgi:hypothetical protein